MLRMLGLPVASWAKQVPSYLFLHHLARTLTMAKGLPYQDEVACSWALYLSDRPAGHVHLRKP